MKGKLKMGSKSKDQQKYMKNVSMVPPDGKYGWIIVLSYAIANVSNKGEKKMLLFLKILIFECCRRAYLISELVCELYFFQKNRRSHFTSHFNSSYGFHSNLLLAFVYS